MKKLLVSLTVIFSSTVLMAQSKKIKWGLSLFPNYSFEIINDDGTTPRAAMIEIKNNNTWKFSYSFNVNVSKEISDRIEISSGIGYQNNGGRTNVQELYFLEPQPPFRRIYQGKSRGIFDHHNIEIPLLVRYKFKEVYYLTGGGSAVYNFLNTTTAKVWDKNDNVDRKVHEDKSTSFREFNVYINFGVGRTFNLNKRLNWFIQPYGQFGVLGIAHSVPANRNMLAVGITSGVILK